MMQAMVVRYCLCFLLILARFPGLAQEQQPKEVPLLERTISISFQNEPLESALKKISDLAGCTFSYSPSVIESGKTITYRFEKKSVREILDRLFEGSVQYKARNQYVILTKAPEPTSLRQQVLSGYVVDEATGRRLQDVSVYDPVTLASAVTDAYGFFSIKLDRPAPEIVLAVNKKYYIDTVVMVPSKHRQLLNIPIRINTSKIATMADSVGEKMSRLWKRWRHKQPGINMRNIDDTLRRRFQFSVLPFVGTNHKLSGNVINDISINMLGGYSFGVTTAEFGGLFNIARADVQGVQAAGLFNQAGGTAKGAQLAGLYNISSDAEGVQGAGLFNVIYGGSAGHNGVRYRPTVVQLAGLFNVIIGERKGPQLAGLFNLSSHDAGPVQAAGFLNVAGGEVTGAQVSGFMNIAGRKITGTQISGFMNIVSEIQGSQISVFNFADSVSGIPIGLMSFVVKGYHKLEIAADEIFYTNIAFRTGVHRFYNILTVGAKPHTFNDSTTSWTFGYGIGTAPRITRHLSLNIDLTSNQIVQGNTIEATQLLNKLYVGADIQFLPKVSLTVGATLNALVTDKDYDAYEPLFMNYNPRIIHDGDLGRNSRLQMWFGAKVGLRFF